MNRTEQTPAQLAKAALRRLALSKQEPTPENYAAAYAQEAGGAPAAASAAGSEALPERAQQLLSRLMALGIADGQTRLEIAGLLRETRWDEALRRVERLQASDGPAAQAEALAGTLERLVRGLERGGRQWTLARKKDGLQRLLASNRSDPQRLLTRLRQLLQNWDSDVADASVDTQFSPEDAGGTPSQFFSDSEFAAELDPDEADERSAPADLSALAPTPACRTGPPSKAAWRARWNMRCAPPTAMPTVWPANCWPNCRRPRPRCCARVPMRSRPRSLPA